MAITKIKITNFKSFKELELELGNFNVLIGANASGKSNFVLVFEFLRDIVHSGLVNAVSEIGGVKYLRNITISDSEKLTVEITFSPTDEWISTVHEKEEPWIGKEIYELSYKFALIFKKKRPKFEIDEDRLIQKCNFYKLWELGKKKEKIGQGDFIISNVGGEIKVELENPSNEKVEREKEKIRSSFFPSFLKAKLPNTLLLSDLFYLIKDDLFRDIAIYDFDPKLPKKATPITGKAELEEDGSNLSIIVKNITENKDKKRKLFNLVKYLLPFVNNLDVEEVVDKFLLFIQEIYFKEDQPLPAFLISDGTINIIALIIALYFEQKPIIIIEEPERNIHPYLISRVVEMMKEASQNKQIIVTTHNPEIVKYAGLDNILLVSRDKDGFSTISRPRDKEMVNSFLQNEIGIEDLYVQNLLGV
ncbi:MAG: AAA family ATPase [bacterium]